MSEPAIYNRATSPRPPPQQQNQFSALRDYVYRPVNTVNRHNREVIALAELNGSLDRELATIKDQMATMQNQLKGLGGFIASQNRQIAVVQGQVASIQVMVGVACAKKQDGSE